MGPTNGEDCMRIAKPVSHQGDIMNALTPFLTDFVSTEFGECTDPN
jgi:hypothetical protein